MIDFITLSDKPGLDTHHIDKCLGVEYAKSITFNTVRGYPHITKAYNAAAASGNNPIICFLHDDVELICYTDQLRSAIDLAVQPTTGIVGVCGSTRLQQNATWWEGLTREEIAKCCLGRVRGPNGLLSWNGFGQSLIVDGCFLLMRRDLWQELQFDEDLTYCHFYDIDICLRSHLAGYKNQVVNLPIFHDSLGNYDETWQKARKQFINNGPLERSYSLEDS